MRYVVTLYKKYTVDAYSQNEAIMMAKESYKDEAQLEDVPLYVICKKVVQ